MKKTILASTIIIASLLSSVSAIASDSPSWNYVEGAYITMDAGDELEPAGLSGKFSTTLMDSNVFLNAKLSSLTDEIYGQDVDVVEFQANVGYKYAISPTTDLFASVGFARMSVEVMNFDEDEDATLLSVGGVTTFKRFEFEGSIDYIDTDFGSETGYTISGHYALNDSISFGASFASIDDTDTTMISLRYAY